MNEVAALALAAVVGVLLGAMFFGGLWWTIRKSLVSRWPASLFSLSLFIRTAIAVGGFYLAFQGGIPGVWQSDWRRLPACLLGFLLARVVVTRLTRLPTARTNLPNEGAA